MCKKLPATAPAPELPEGYPASPPRYGNPLGSEPPPPPPAAMAKVHWVVLQLPLMSVAPPPGDIPNSVGMITTK